MTYTQYKYANNAISYLTQNINTTDTTITVQDWEGAIFPEAPFLVTLESEVQGVVNAREIVKVTAKSWDTFTIERWAWVCVQNDSAPMKVQGDSALEFPVGSRVCQYIQAELFDNVIEWVVEQSGVRAGAQESTVWNIAVFSDTDWHEIVDGWKALNDMATKNYVDTAISTAVSSTYKFMGSVATYADLPTTDLQVWDTYDVRAAFTKDWESYPAGTDVAWTGTDWDPLGWQFDTSNLVTKTETLLTINGTAYTQGGSVTTPNTTYDAMTAAEFNTGTSTDPRTITPAIARANFVMTNGTKKTIRIGTEANLPSTKDANTIYLAY